MVKNFRAIYGTQFIIALVLRFLWPPDLCSPKPKSSYNAVFNFLKLNTLRIKFIWYTYRESDIVSTRFYPKVFYLVKEINHIDLQPNTYCRINFHICLTEIAVPQLLCILLRNGINYLY